VLAASLTGHGPACKGGTVRVAGAGVLSGPADGAGAGRCGPASTQGLGLSGRKQKAGQNAEKEEKENEKVFFFLEPGFNNFSILFLNYLGSKTQNLYINLKVLILNTLEIFNVSQIYYKILFKL